MSAIISWNKTDLVKQNIIKLSRITVTLRTKNHYSILYEEEHLKNKLRACKFYSFDLDKSTVQPIHFNIHIDKYKFLTPLLVLSLKEPQKERIF